MMFMLAATAAPIFAEGPFSTDVFVGGREGYPIYRIPAMVLSSRGAVLAFCEGRKTGIADHGNIDIVQKRSLDGGRTWGPLQVIQSKGFQTWGNPAPVVDRDTGRVWLLFTLNNAQVFVTSSDDEGVSWAEPRDITRDVKPPDWTWYATGPGHAIQLSSGRLLVPCDHRAAGAMASHVIYSDDHGQTWKRGGTLDQGTDECMAVETVDGRVYLSMRNIYGRNRRAYAWSDDGGLTWSKVRMEDELVDPTCQASIIRLSAGHEPGKNRILFLNPASPQRENISIRVSYDEGESWSAGRTISSGPGAYSDLVVLPDLTVGALYENGKIWPYSKISFARLNPDWITGGKDRP